MPPVHTHTNFVRLVFEGRRARYERDYLICGAIAPDCFDRNDQQSFRTHHFATDHAEIDPAHFLQATHLSRAGGDRRVISFVSGYYSHLWLDIYVRTRDSSIPARYPDASTDNEKRDLLRANIEYFDLLDIASFVQEASPISLKPIVGFEFVSFDAVAHQWSVLVARSAFVLSRTGPRLVIAREAYDRFLQDAVDQFLQSE